MIRPDTTTVTAAELVRHFGVVRRQADAAPVRITNHGRDAHVLCSVDHFRALCDRPADRPGEGVSLDMAQLAAWIDQGVLLLDQRGFIVHANAALLAIMPHDPARLIGCDAFAAIPELIGTLIETYLRRALISHEATLFDVPSPFRDGGWLQCRLAAIGDQVALLFRDITGDVKLTRRRSLQAELLQAIALVDGVAVVRLSLRGHVEEVDAGFATLTGMTAETVGGTHFCDLVFADDRAAVRGALEAVLGEGRGQAIDARLLTTRGAIMPVRIGAAYTRSGYADDRATLLISGEVAACTRPRLIRAAG